MESKVCTKCLEEKSISLFGKRSSAKDGLSYFCKDCISEKDRKYRENNSVEVKERKKRYYSENADAIKSLNRKWRLENIEKARKSSNQWKVKNPAKHRASSIERYAMKMNRCPAWAKELTSVACKEAYDKARKLTELTGVPHDVDHIVPLKGRTVCGLHIYSNLQVLPARLNRSKQNRWWPDMWEAA